jgi:hypothetical protein
MAKNTIVGKGLLNNRDQIVATAVAITPGALLERTAAGLVQAHSGAAGTEKVEALFALEDYLQGKGIDDAYAVSVPIMTWKCVPGERVYANVTGTVPVATYLESDGAGALRPWTAGKAIAIALEAKVGTRALVEII